ncbi:MAG: hypothetical protein ACF8MJ_02095 [Phycisphaerales bacterium JB050]
MDDAKRVIAARPLVYGLLGLSILFQGLCWAAMFAMRPSVAVDGSTLVNLPALLALAVAATLAVVGIGIASATGVWSRGTAVCAGGGIGVAAAGCDGVGETPAAARLPPHPSTHHRSAAPISREGRRRREPLTAVRGL